MNHRVQMKKKIKYKKSKECPGFQRAWVWIGKLPRTCGGDIDGGARCQCKIRKEKQFQSADHMTFRGTKWSLALDKYKTVIRKECRVFHFGRRGWLLREPSALNWQWRVQCSPCCTQQGKQGRLEITKGPQLIPKETDHKKKQWYKRDC